MVAPVAFVVVLLLALAWWGGPGWRPRPVPGVQRRRPWAIGHRGARGPREENTADAFDLALTLVDGIETDVQRTADGVLVLWHDFDVAGLEVRRASLESLRERAPRLVTVQELFRIARDHPGTLLNLEIKSRPAWLRAWTLERDLVAAVRASGLEDRVLVSSFDPLALARVRLSAPRLRTALLTTPDAPRGLRSGRAARWLHVDALHPEDRQVDAPLLARCRRRGLPVHVWTVNDAIRMEELAREGVGGVIGDDPSVLARHGKEPPA